jgi:LuxR family maltose regulon positive regulatory protein
MTTALLRTKFYLPPLRLELVPRPRLVERLQAGLHRKLTLISAPAGFGKTTLLSEWIASYSQGESPLGIAWLSLDEGDNDQVRFWTHVIAALQTVRDDVGQAALSMLQSPQPPPTETLLTGLINELAEHPEPLFLVLDDFHLITERRITDAVAFLLEHEPPQMHLILASRADPPWPLARLRARGEITELRVDDLRFTAAEAAAFLNEAMGLSLRQEEIAALDARTEGWIAGLQLAAIAMQSPSLAPGVADLSAFVQAFGASHRFILDYLIEEVLDRQPPTIQEFLLQTSILERMSAPLCEAVRFGFSESPSSSSEPAVRFGFSESPSSSSRTPHPPNGADSQTILTYLDQANLFVVPLDDGRRWYRYHGLFGDLLRNRLQQTRPDQVPALHQRASAWHEQSGHTAEAIQHALSGGDFERAARLLERAGEGMLMRGEFDAFLSWAEAVPDDVLRARPTLCMNHAVALLMAGRPLDHIEACLKDAAEITTIQALVASHQGDMEKCAELSTRALELLPQESLFLRSMMSAVLGVAYLLLGDARSSIGGFEQAARIGQTAGNLLSSVLALRRLAALHTILGQLGQAEALLHQALELAVDQHGRPLPMASMVLIDLADLLRERNDLQIAMEHLRKGLELGVDSGGFWAVDGYLVLARVRQAQGDFEAARQAMREAQQLAASTRAHTTDDTYAAALQARLWAALGELEAAWRWVEESGLAEGDSGGSPLYLIREIEQITLARIFLAQRQFDRALEVLRPLHQAAEDLERWGILIEIMTLESLALEALGDLDDALLLLARALSMAAPEGYVRIFVNEGEPMGDLLRRVAARGVAIDYVGKLLAVLAAERRADPAQPAGQLVEPLTERELEVLHYLVTSLSIPEIAQDLVVAPSTVRSHVKNIYGKLGVHRRMEAVARARELGLF